jgi:hypothetical protein
VRVTHDDEDTRLPKGLREPLFERDVTPRKVPATLKMAVNAKRTVETPEELHVWIESGHSFWKNLHCTQISSAKNADLLSKVAMNSIA